MRSSTLAALGAVLLLSTTGCASLAPANTGAGAVLPLRTLRLYETGVGYFERSGKVPARADAGLPVPAGHLDDALKTLVVLSPDGKTRVDGIEFGSSLSHGMARAMAGLPLEDGDVVGYETLLMSLKGSRVELRTPKETPRGRLGAVANFPVETTEPPAATAA